MSIRYTLRHNIPSDKLAEEDVNDSSTWDLNLLRKHELAETDSHDIVYRKHDGEVVNWADAATQQANEILEEVQDLSAHIDNQADVVLAQLEEVSIEVATLTEEAQEANESAQDALVQANLTVSESQANADSASESSTSAREWAIKMDGLVDNDEYSSKYYAQQSAGSASRSANDALSARSSATAAQRAASTAAQDAVEDASSLLESYVTDATNAKNSAISAKTSAETAATNSATSATLSQNWATKTNGKVDGSEYSAKYYAQQSSLAANASHNYSVSSSNSADTARSYSQSALNSLITAGEYAQKAEQWATEMNGTVDDSEEYSAKYYATESANSATSASGSADLAEQWATKTSGTVDGTEYSAKYYAEQAQDTADDLSESLEQIATNTANIEENAENIATNTGNIAQNTTDIDIAEKRIGNIEKLLQGNLYDYQTDSTSAYTKSVPAGAMPYASIEQIGGKTVVFNQLYRVVDGSSTTYGVSIVRSASANTYTVSGTANTTGTIWLTSSNPDGTAYSTETLINGHKYATLLKGNNLPLFRHSYDGETKSNKSYILTGNGSWRFPVGIEVTSGVTYNFTVKIMLVDLTLMFGAGNEPTIEQFETMYPADWYNATYGTLLSAGVTEVESVGRNLLDKNAVFENWTNILSGYYYTFRLEPNTTYFCYSTLPLSSDNSANLFFYASNDSASTSRNGVWNGQTRYVTTLADGIVTMFSRTTGYSPQTKEYYLSHDFMLAKSETPVAYAPYTEHHHYPIPTAIQALEGYGWSAGSVFNYIDYERKVFVKRVGSVDLGTLTWTYITGASAFSSNTIPGLYERQRDTDNNAICEKYVPQQDGWLVADMNNMSFFIRGDNTTIYIKDTNYTDATAFTSAMSGVMLYYQLATPIETDISAYITDDNLIEVESGGSLTFPNSNGTDYQIPVPSAETYMVDLQASL